jgi:hypothetical protein
MVDSMVSSTRSPYLLTLALNIEKNVLSALNNRKNACQIITTQPKIKTYFPMPLISRSSSFVLGILLLMCCSVALLHGNKGAYQEKYSNRWLLSISA